MARRERRRQPRIPIEIEVILNDATGGTHEPVRLHLRTRNVNTRGAFFELPAPESPPMPWSTGDFWREKRVLIHTSGPPLAEGGELHCEAEVRWVERRGPKKLAVGIGVLFLTPSEEWLDALNVFLDSLVT